MVSAPAVSLDEYRQVEVRREIRQRLREQFGERSGRLEPEVTKDRPSLSPRSSTGLEGLARTGFAIGHQLTGMVTESLIKSRHNDALGRSIQGRTVSDVQQDLVRDCG
jgi:hypothetical protein